MATRSSNGSTSSLDLYLKDNTMTKPRDHAVVARALAASTKKVEALNQRIEKARKTYETVASACTAKLNNECLSRSALVKEYERLVYGCELQQNDILRHKRTGDIAIVLLVLNHDDEVQLGLDYRATTGMCHGKDYKLRSINKPGWEKIGHKPSRCF